METIAPDGASVLFSYGPLGVFVVILVLYIWRTSVAQGKERLTQEKRDNDRETALRGTVAKAFDERHEDSTEFIDRLARIDTKLGVPKKDA